MVGLGTIAEIPSISSAHARLARHWNLKVLLLLLFYDITSVYSNIFPYTSVTQTAISSEHALDCFGTFDLVQVMVDGLGRQGGPGTCTLSYLCTLGTRLNLEPMRHSFNFGAFP